MTLEETSGTSQGFNSSADLPSQLDYVKRLEANQSNPNNGLNCTQHYRRMSSSNQQKVFTVLLVKK